MKAGTKIALFYTAITVGAITVVVAVLFLIASTYINYALASATDHQAGLVSGRLIFYLGLLLVALVVVSAFGVYWVGKRYAVRIIDRIDAAYHSEKTFIGNASHELNNPLTAIQGECEITLLKERTPLEYQLSLQRIASETKRIINLMKSLLFLSHGDDEIITSGIEPVFLAEFLMRFVKNRVTFSPDNFAFTLNVNPALLKIAIENIINNALKYSPEDKPVEMRLKGHVLEIRDYGIGIPEKDLEQIAQPFFRASNTRSYAGHGVGLSLSIRILNNYGAKIMITSAEGEGTHILIDFP